MDRCSECLFEFVDNDLLALPLREDWHEFVYANADPAITVWRGSALCLRHLIPVMEAEL